MPTHQRLVLLLTKLYDNFNFDRMFLLSKRVSLSEKGKYLLRKYFALLTRKSSIAYLGHTFTYDNPFTPVLLQGYPAEIETLDAAIQLKNIRSALDIGANIGQWAFTLKSLFPHIHVYSIEPNPEIFKLLRDNCHDFKDWQAYNIGIGDGASHKFLYYFGNGSAEASIFTHKVESNALKKVAVKLIILNEENIKGYKLLRSYDLVKIDVEGAELEVLHSIKQLQFKFLSVEVAIKRERGIKVDDVTRFFLKHTRRKAKLLTVEMVSTNAPAGNAIFALS